MHATVPGRMRRTAFGHWLEDAGPVAGRPPLDGRARADVLVIGGGYLGMWTAWQLAGQGADVVLCEAGLCGHGPSGRNGGFVETMWQRLPELRRLFGDDGALVTARAAATTVDGIASWCEEQRVDAQVVRAPMLEVSAAPGQDGSWDEAVAACQELGVADEVRVLDGAAARRVCDVPLFRGGVAWTTFATVHPARLALGLRQRLLDRGVRIHEHTRIAALDDGPRGVAARTADGAEVVARSAVLAINHATAGVAPLRGSLSVASSHIVATKPVPEALERLGWTGGEPIADSRTMLHYLRTTRDGRIVFGWGGGRMGYGARRRPALDVDPPVQDAAARDLRSFFGDLPLDHAWGGPIDVSPVRLPWFGTLHSTHYGFGFTGNGVGPAHLGGRILADLVRDERSELTRLPLVGGVPPRRFPPEPLRFAGGSAIRHALVRRDDADAEGRRADPLTRAVASLPRLLGLHLPR
jgi:glycine/D-amino acid oxidase-like deaminating enzyme